MVAMSWKFFFGVLGNIMSFMVYLSPVPTFYRVYKKKSTAGFQSFPYVVALFSAMTLIYYAIIKTNAYLILTVNSAGCLIEIIYITMYLVYANKKARIYTVKTMLLLNVGVFSVIVLGSYLGFKGPNRVKVVGWINMTFSVSVFAAPLSIIKLVIKTKSVEFMPFFLSFFLTLSAIAWFGYGLLTKDVYVAFPNTLGFIFGVIQMLLYVIYKDAKKVVKDDKLPQEQGPAIPVSEVEVQRVETCTVPVPVPNDDIEMGMEGKDKEETTSGNNMNLGIQNEVACAV